MVCDYLKITPFDIYKKYIIIIHFKFKIHYINIKSINSFKCKNYNMLILNPLNI